MIKNITSNIKLNSIERRFQMLLGIFLFFPTLISALGGTIDVQSKSILNWSFVLSFLVLAYVFLEINGNKIGDEILKVLNILVLINIALFSPILFFITKYKETMPTTIEDVFRVLILSVMWIPVIIFGLLGIRTFLLFVDWIVGFVSMKKK